MGSKGFANGTGNITNVHWHIWKGSFEFWGQTDFQTMSNHFQTCKSFISFSLICPSLNLLCTWRWGRGAQGCKFHPRAGFAATPPPPSPTPQSPTISCPSPLYSHYPWHVLVAAGWAFFSINWVSLHFHARRPKGQPSSEKYHFQYLIEGSKFKPYLD